MLIGQNNYPPKGRAQVLEVERAYDWSDQPAQLGKDKACECAESRKTSKMQV